MGEDRKPALCIENNELGWNLSFRISGLGPSLAMNFNLRLHHKSYSNFSFEL